MDKAAALESGASSGAARQQPVVIAGSSGNFDGRLQRAEQMVAMKLPVDSHDAFLKAFYQTNGPTNSKGGTGPAVTLATSEQPPATTLL